ncbi:MAG: ribbon-helix-helix protein, CopG family [Candidatus Bathyarchaeota archaeon]|nr:MAG: ribbon-helix-helix protein, CopG family [Candidatus Bathyarchaeota archaeon]
MFEEPKMEKLTINLPPIEIARIDMLIGAGFYPSRAEFIRAAIRDRLDSHQDFISKKLEQITGPSEREEEQETYAGMGVYVLDNKAFERALQQGIKMKIRVVGMLKLSDDVQPELIERVVESVKIYGVVRGSHKAKQALQSKMERG